jgi:hypothetical protein
MDANITLRRQAATSLDSKLKTELRAVAFDLAKAHFRWRINDPSERLDLCAQAVFIARFHRRNFPDSPWGALMQPSCLRFIHGVTGDRHWTVDARDITTYACAESGYDIQPLLAARWRMDDARRDWEAEKDMLREIASFTGTPHPNPEVKAQQEKMIAARLAFDLAQQAYLDRHSEMLASFTDKEPT